MFAITKATFFRQRKNISEGSFNSLGQRSQFLDELPWGLLEERAERRWGDTGPEDEPTITIDSHGERRQMPQPERGKFLPRVEEL